MLKFTLLWNPESWIEWNDTFVIQNLLLRKQVHRVKGEVWIPQSQKPVAYSILIKVFFRLLYQNWNSQLHKISLSLQSIAKEHNYPPAGCSSNFLPALQSHSLPASPYLYHHALCWPHLPFDVTWLSFPWWPPFLGHHLPFLSWHTVSSVLLVLSFVLHLPCGLSSLYPSSSSQNPLWNLWLEISKVLSLAPVTSSLSWLPPAAAVPTTGPVCPTQFTSFISPLVVLCA